MKKAKNKIYSLSADQALSLLRKKGASVGIVGCGYIGSCIAAILSDQGIRTVGIDVNKRLVEDLNKGLTSLHEPNLKELLSKSVRSGKLQGSLDFRALQDVDIILITVGTPLSGKGSPDMSHIVAASKAVAKNLKKGHLVVLKSTLPPGSTEGIVKNTLEASGLKAGRDFGLVFSPERLSEGTAIRELLSLPMIVGGSDKKSAELTAKFWELTLKVKTVIVSSAKAAEMSKLADNLWIDLNIALGNEIALLCDKLGIDAMEVIRAANTLPKSGSTALPGVAHNVNILTPSMGVGGYCLTKDPWFVHSIGKDHGLDLKTPVASRTVNDLMPAYTFDLIKRTLLAHGKKAQNSKVAVLGLSFKSNTGDCRFTPTKYTIELLGKNKYKVAIYDPLVSKEDAKTVTSIPMASSLEEAVRGADCIALFTGHRQFKEFPLKQLKKLATKKCVLIDGRNMFDLDEIQEIKRLGFTYQGIGRA
ncbi:MAG: nucleotide sugar dehydrogenase [bacterium]|nr:nucleotide sugar dehydrogenase [bacterium]